MSRADHRERNSSPNVGFTAWKVALVVIALWIGYVASYFAMVERSGVFMPWGSGPWNFSACYDYGEPFVNHLFRPVNWVDRKLRPDHWTLERHEISAGENLPSRAVPVNRERGLTDYLYEQLE